MIREADADEITRVLFFALLLTPAVRRLPAMAIDSGKAFDAGAYSQVLTNRRGGRQERAPIKGS